MLNKFALPSRNSWFRFLGWAFFKSLISLLLFILVCIKNALNFLLWLTNQLIDFTKNFAFIIDNLIYGGVFVKDADRIVDSTTQEENPLQAELKFFNFEDIRNYPNKFPHIRLIAKTGGGKTTTTEWLMGLLGGEQFVITAVKKPGEWTRHEVFGHPFNYQLIEDKLKQVHSLMYERYRELDEGLTPHQINFVLDEWRIIQHNTMKARELVKDVITVARGAKIRLIAIAHGEGTAMWGFEGEKDLADCFTTIRLGIFAKKHCQKLINQHRRNSTEYDYYSKAMEKLKEAGEFCCMVDDEVASIPYIPKPQKPNPQIATQKIASNVTVFSTSSTNDYSQTKPINQTYSNQKSNQLQQYEQLILRWGQSNIGQILTARDLQSTTRLFKSMSAQEIRNIFQTLASKNLGAITGEGAKLGWVFF